MGTLRNHESLIHLVASSACDRVVILCFMGEDSAEGLDILIRSIRVVCNQVFLITI
ncbi:hypothetical protein PaeBR_03475 [Paenibacillus sp. BR2-3]|uniref:hypothetical protein n=1 Tax=Paenibacillus sp. BR2-3 TaxID=3048494 RepID=UPI003977A958